MEKLRKFVVALLAALTLLAAVPLAAEAPPAPNPPLPGENGGD